MYIYVFSKAFSTFFQQIFFSVFFNDYRKLCIYVFLVKLFSLLFPFFQQKILLYFFQRVCKSNLIIITVSYIYILLLFTFFRLLYVYTYMYKNYFYDK